MSDTVILAPRREIFAWGMYDFANSAFATVVLSAIFPLIFVKVLVGEGGNGAALWGYLVSASMLVAAFAAPLIGAITDTTASKKRFLFCFWLSACLATCSLGFFGPGQWIPAAVLFVIANVGFSSGNALYNAFLPELAPRGKMDSVSGFGWGIGYLGGGACLALGLLMIRKWNATGETMALAGGWWFLFALPFFFAVKERAMPQRVRGSRVTHGFKKVLLTLRRVRRYPELAKFLLAYLIFNDGVQTVITMATVFGERLLKMTPDDLVLCLLMIQGVALVGSLLLGWLAHGIGTKRALVVSLLVWCGAVSWAFFLSSRVEFWILGAVVGLVLGGTQAISRSMMGKFTPPGRSGEFFGFYAVGGKFAAFLGPLLFGLATQLTGNVRYGVLSVAVFFVAGLFLLLTVNEAKGIEQAKASE